MSQSGRPKDPNRIPKKAYPVYTSADRIATIRQAVLLPSEPFDKLADLIAKAVEKYGVKK